MSTKIEWTEDTWSPLLGCRRVSPGCGVTDAGGCYAERMARRLSGPGRPYEGLVRGTSKGPRWTGKRRTASDRMTIPIRRRVPTVWFVNSMGDLFFEGHRDEDIDGVFGVMWACLYAAGRAGDDGVPGHVFQCLTKRAERMHDYMNQNRRRQHAEAAVTYGGGRDPDGLFDMVMGYDGPHPRIWLGVSAEDQQRADERIPWLLDTPAAVRFVSAEPLLGPLDLGPYLVDDLHRIGRAPRMEIDQVIVGGESGPKSRPFHLEWWLSIAEQCREADVAAFFKQAGANPVRWRCEGCGEYRADEHAQTVTHTDPDTGGPVPVPYPCGPMTPERVVLTDSKGGDLSELPPPFRVREFPEVRRG